MSMNPRRKKAIDKKDPAAAIREAAFNEQFSKDKSSDKTESQPPAAETNTEKPLPVTSNKAISATQPSSDTNTLSEAVPANQRAKKPKKTAKSKYVTLNVESDTALAAQIAAKMVSSQLKDFTKTAIQKHIRSLIKKGELPELPQFDL